MRPDYTAKSTQIGDREILLEHPRQPPGPRGGNRPDYGIGGSRPVTSARVSTRLNTAERVAAELRRSIRYGDLLPGEHVRQEEWAERIGVSRVPVREALKILAAEGLLLHDPHRGHFVAKMAADDMAQIYRMRTLLEPEVLRSVTWPSPQELSMLRSQIKRIAEAMAVGDIAEALEIDRDFHFFIYNLSPLRFIVEEVKRLWSMCDSYRAASMRTLRRSDPEESPLLQRHTEIVNALRHHDRDRLVQIVLSQRLELLDLLSDTRGTSQPRKTLAGPEPVAESNKAARRSRDPGRSVATEP